jgi:uncharacterized membrane protein YjjB (DUF3815 family)
MGTAHLALLNQRVTGTTQALEIAFLTRLGYALSAASDPVSSTERTLRRIAQRNGLSGLQIAVLPTLVLVRGHDGPLPIVDLATADSGHDLRLDQIGALYDIVQHTLRGQLSAGDGATGPLLLLIPPLITFLPGGMLTTAMVELADRHSIAGASRLLAGATQVLLLVFGIVAAQALVGLPPEMAYARRADIAFGAWAPWLGSLLFAIGVYYHFVGPPRSLVWLCLIVYVASLGEFLGNSLLSGSFGGFVGALTMTVVAFWLDRLPAAPPFQVLFLPAFWLLVPGVLAVVGLADLVGNPASVALVDLGQVAVTIVSIALGVLVGVALTRALRWSDLG